MDLDASGVVHAPMSSSKWFSGKIIRPAGTVGWSNADIAALVSLYRDGYTARYIMASFPGTGWKVIARLLRDALYRQYGPKWPRMSKQGYASINRVEHHTKYGHVVLHNLRNRWGVCKITNHDYLPKLRPIPRKFASLVVRPGGVPPDSKRIVLWDLHDWDVFLSFYQTTISTYELGYEIAPKINRCPEVCYRLINRVLSDKNNHSSGIQPFNVAKVSGDYGKYRVPRHTMYRELLAAIAAIQELGPSMELVWNKSTMLLMGLIRGVVQEWVDTSSLCVTLGQYGDIRYHPQSRTYRPIDVPESDT